VANDSAEESIRKLEGKFTQPAFVGDALTVRVWKDKTSPPSIQRYFFVVVNEETGVTLLDCGCAELELRDHHAEMSRSKL
jgi:acyl dehydratase